VVAPPKAGISQNGNTLFAQPPGMMYQWYSGPVSSGNLLAGETNQYFIPAFSEYYCVVVTDMYGCKDTACIDFIPDGIAGLPDGSWNIYPNPSGGPFTASIISEKQVQVQLKIFNSLGEIIDLRTFVSPEGRRDYYIENEHLATGLYLIVLQTEAGRGTKILFIE
jgi:hypothetical protein